MRVFDEPLPIRSHRLYVILQAIGPRLGLTDADVEVIAARMPTYEDDTEDDDLFSAKPYQVTPDSIALIGVSGTLVKKASWMSIQRNRHSMRW